jgi:uncharacterized repeat protein (TIGR03803 family)
MTRLSVRKMACTVVLLSVATAVVVQAQNFTTLVSFDGTNGAYPSSTLVQGIDGNFYGTASSTLFKLTPTGGLTTLYEFCSKPNCTDGSSPSGLVLGTDGSFYGTTATGGSNSNEFCTSGCGTVFKITSAGKYSTIYNFCSRPKCADGFQPDVSLIQASDGSFYGTTGGGGTSRRGFGTIFRITAEGKLATIYRFQKSEDDTGYDPTGPLMQGTDLNLYGTTVYGGEASGENGAGTAFLVFTSGLVGFSSFGLTVDSGVYPLGGLVEALDGNLYSTTSDGGQYGRGTVSESGLGDGMLGTLYSFCAFPNCADGGGPHAGVIQATDGSFYGTTTLGGTNGDGGTLYKITSSGALTTLYSFCAQTNCTDGNSPIGGLLQATNGKFYGMTLQGGAYGIGTIFSVGLGFEPFVSLQRNPAPSGQPFGILGQGLTGTTSVSLNGIPASFTVISNTFIKATVPPGATTGYVTVITPSGTLTSNVPFNVIP